MALTSGGTAPQLPLDALQQISQAIYALVKVTSPSSTLTSLVVGTPTGGNQGTGTVNATNYYINGHLIDMPIAFSYTGKPAAGARVTVPITTYLQLQSNVPGSAFYCTTNPSALATFTLNKISGGATTTIGQVGVSTGGASVFSTSGVTLAPGDAIQMIAPGTQDTTLADLGITIRALRI